MSRFEPEEFWVLYRQQLTHKLQSEPRETCDRVWTPEGTPIWTKRFAIPAAEEACKQLKLHAEERLLRLDVAGFERRREDDYCNWDLRVAFEHENKPGSWPDELCKLCHIVADLRVLVAYYCRAGKGSFQKELQERINLMDDRVDRVPQSKWLFICGPVDSSKDDTGWMAFKLESGRELQTIPEDNPFSPYSIYVERYGHGSSWC